MARKKQLEDRVVGAHWLFWVAIPGLLTLLAFMGFSEGFYNWFSETLYNPGGRTMLRWVFIACIPIHCFEGAWAYRRAKELGMRSSARQWAWMCFVVGLPGSYQLLKVSKQKAHVYEGAKVIPHVPGPPIVGNSIAFAKSPLEFVCEASKRGDVVRFRVGPDNWYLINHPDLITDVLVKRANRFHKPAVARRLWKPFLGNGLLTLEDEEWKRESKLMRPAFHHKRIAEYGKVMVEYTEDRLASYAEGESRDFQHEMTEITLAIVGKTLFDADVRGDAKAIGDAMEVISDVLVAHINFPLPVPKWWPSAANKKKVKAIETFHSLVRRVIADRRADGIDRGDLLSTLVFAKSDEGHVLSDQALMDESMTLFFAGHETTALSLTWMWYLMAQHPDVQDKAREEVMRVAADRPLTVEDLSELPYLNMVVKESMRYLPAVWTFMRTPLEDIRLGDHVVEEGSFIFISPFVTQRDPRFFDDPLTFRPERFLPEAEKAIPKGAYVPFSAGPRVCAGKAFAMMEARLILGTFLKHLVAELPVDYEFGIIPLLSLHPKNGLTMQVRRHEPEGMRAASK